MFWYWLIWCLIYLPVRILYPTKLIGRANLPKKSKGILTCNHFSNMDPLLLASHFHRRVFMLAKHTLFEKKFQAKLLSELGGIPVNRGELALSTVKRVREVLNNKNLVLIFPQGTRKTSLEENEALKNGTAMFALKTNSPIIPMYLLKKPRIFCFNKIIVGEPIYLDQYKDVKITKDLLTEISDIVLIKMTELKNQYEK